MGWDIDVKEKIYLRLANEIFFRLTGVAESIRSGTPN